MKICFRFWRLLLVGSLLSGTCLRAYGQSTANTSFWTGDAENGLWNTAGNWNFGEDNLPASIAPQGQAFDQQNVLFINASDSQISISLGLNTRLSPSPGDGDVAVKQGNFIINLNNRTFQFASYYWGDSSGATEGNISFTNTGATPRDLTITGVVVGGKNHTYDLQAVLTNLNGNTDENVTAHIGQASLAGHDNHLIVNPGDSIVNTGSPEIFALTGTSTNNSLEINGGSLSMSSVILHGFYDATDPGNILTANNKVLIYNNGNLNLTQPFTVEAGTEFRIESGGKVSVNVSPIPGMISVDEHGSLVLDGPGSVLKGSYIPSDATAFDGFDLSIAGDASIRNGATVTGLRILTVAETGQLVMEGVTIDLTASLVGNGHLSLDQGSQLNAPVLGTVSNLSVPFIDIKGNSVLNTDTWSGVGSSGITVEEGSTFHFNTFGAGGGSTPSINANGKVTWGGGGVTGVAGHDGETDFDLTIGAGTTLVLEAGNTYRMGVPGGGETGKLIIRGGLEGSGLVQGRMELHGAKVNVGGGDSPATLQAGNGMIFLDGQSEVSLTIFGPGGGEYDQLQASQFSLNDADLEVKLELMPSFGEFLGTLTPEEAQDFLLGTSFQLFSNLEGGAINVGDAFTFDFGDSADELAAYGLGWDTSSFGTTGAISITAVPEPSALSMVVLGLASAAVLMRRRRLVQAN